ncbi:prickle planar cell polarity protein 3-A-like isoform X1 [Centruroides sculpturatus]|uniref:prickle planar cell polarity protein 3-A-like isoform X1 n=1 Tax=Centruroides sculpturatus TaxID=218467 RepID=UPI000C6CBB0A|nr:prickle planar cell polarity protein 3-A-like isoform X1 [Centruroides sculpturatus]
MATTAIVALQNGAGDQQMAKTTDEAYLKTGVSVNEVDEGRPCLNCRDNCPGFTPHVWRTICNNCKCPRETHDLYHEEFVIVRNRIGLKNPQDPNKVVSKRRTLEEGYSWIPPGLNSEKVEEYFLQLPKDKIPRLGSSGEKYRDKQLIVQLPKQDLALAYCKFLDKEYQNNYEDFVNNRNETALDIGYVKTILEQNIECHKCQGSMGLGDIVVQAPKLGENYSWHPGCFVCCVCEELLVDLTYCVKENKLYCERHFAEQIRPRCAACDELIFAGEYTKAMSKDWHSTHFCCWQCDETLTGQRYVLRDEHPYCVRCYEQVFSNTCDECGKPIGIDSKDLSYKEKHWHESCFLCNKCQMSLVDKPFGSKSEKVYCANCYDNSFASRCDACNEVFRAGTKKMEYKGKQWHEKCFCCIECNNPIGTKSFIPRDSDIFCTTCYEQKFSTRCVKCNQIITTGGVTYRNEPWHRECFCCTNCEMCLAGQRFTSRDEKPYCAECFGELFAKRCNACNKPITGIGGTRFISFEDRNWHNDCFLCASCNLSLVGKGFITDGSDILCPDCAKQKLM